MNHLPYRLKCLLYGWGTVGLIYLLTDRLQSEGALLPRLPIDVLIPFSPDAIWLYLSFFLIVPLSYLLAPLAQLPILTRATQLAALGSGIIYLAYPTTMLYPEFSTDSVSSILLSWLIVIDSSQNCFPSLHMTLTLLAIWSIAMRRQFWLTLINVVWAAAITFSIIQLRRHLFLDLMGGVVLAWCCGWAALYLSSHKVPNKVITNASPDSK